MNNRQGDLFGEPDLPDSKFARAVRRLCARPGLARAVACVLVAWPLARARVRGVTARQSAILEAYIVAIIDEPFNHEDRLALLCLAGLRPPPDGEIIPPNWFPDPEEVAIEEKEIWKRAERKNLADAKVIRRNLGEPTKGGGHG